MYRVYFIFGEEPACVISHSYDTLNEAAEFALTRPENTVLEIKYYDNIDRRKPDRN